MGGEFNALGKDENIFRKHTGKIHLTDSVKKDDNIKLNR
jgi:hypothetical protein